MAGPKHYYLARAPIGLRSATAKHFSVRLIVRECFAVAHAAPKRFAMEQAEAARRWPGNVSPSAGQRKAVYPETFRRGSGAARGKASAAGTAKRFETFRRVACAKTVRRGSRP